ncbi:MAG: EAL domain-containing protein [Burkholderiales bacterium]|nr:EAL domain-containing protein [Burkholderiales bacterium]
MDSNQEARPHPKSDTPASPATRPVVRPGLSLRTRIALLIALLLVVLQGAALLMITRTSDDIARSTASETLLRGERIFQQLLTQNQAQLTQAASVLTADFGFRAAVATRDMATMEDALRNHGSRIDAQAMLLLAPDFSVLVDTLDSGRARSQAELAPLIAAPADAPAASRLAVLDGKVHQLVMVPVRAPDLVAWVVIGFLIDDADANELKSVSGMDVTFASQVDGGQWRIHATTLVGSLRSEFSGLIREAAAAGMAGDAELVLAGERWQLHRTDLNPTTGPTSATGASGGTAISVFLQRPLSAVTQPFERLNMAFIWLSAIGLALGIIGSLLIARRIAEPIRALGHAARRIQQGDYGTPVPAGPRDEIGTLADGLDHMRQGIARREGEILRLAYEDGLTALPNRTMFLERLNQSLKLARRDGPQPVVMLLDLDRFKTINDTLGHEVGDLALREAGQRIASTLREADSVARLGGDEFAILLTSAVPEQAQTAARRIVDAMEAPFSIAGQSMDIGTSIGIARFPEHGTEASELMRAADVAMYAAKRAKIGYTTYDPSLDGERQSHLTLLGELRRAVEDGQLKLLYQPKLTLADGRITAVEALVRWVHPERGMVPPNDFIPFAEQTGYITRITRWVVGEAVRQCGVWRGQGLDIRISINASTRDLQVRENLPSLLRTTLAEHGVPPQLICVEITEGALMDDPAGARKIIGELHQLGVSLSIDDYGTGYSSLAYLKELTVNELKIDRSFVVGMQNDPQSLAIVRSTIELGHNLGLHVVAEGVESEEDIDMLRRAGCDAVQGYGISRPLDAEHIPARIGSGTT